MSLFIFFFIIIIVAISVLWANGVEDMCQNHPDYRGEDLFNEN